MRHNYLVGLLVLGELASVGLATPIFSDTRGALPFIRFRQNITADDLLGLGVSVRFSNGRLVTCTWPACGNEAGAKFKLEFSGFQGNHGRFDLTNLTQGTTIQQISFEGLLRDPNDTKHPGNQRLANRIVFDDWLGMHGQGTIGSGVGHPVQGAKVLSYQFGNQLGGADELYSKLTVNLRGGGYNQPIVIRSDLDAGVATPEPASMLLVGGGLALVGIVRQKRQRRPKASA